MAIIKPFRGVRPSKANAASIAALPYDVYDRQEAKAAVRQNPLSFLKIDRPETQFPDDTDMYSQEVYGRAKDTLQEMTEAGLFVRDGSDCYYLYALTMHGRTQTGIVCCASIEDYLDGVICRHEDTREEKELDRIRHVDTLNAQTGPIFLAYRSSPEAASLVHDLKAAPALYDFISEDGVQHQVWKISDKGQIRTLTQIVSKIKQLYIADGHHRAASAVKVGLKRRREHPGYNGTEEFNYFLSVLFPADELQIYDYDRIVSGLNGYTAASLLDKIRTEFKVEETPICRPRKKGEIEMYAAGKWYRLTADPSLFSADPAASLDVSILQDRILGPLLGIQDPKTDPRIQFIGGIRGLEELKRLTDKSPDQAAFAMFPTSMQELMAVADAGQLMPPKSTWFEPKLRSGLFIHTL